MKYVIFDCDSTAGLPGKPMDDALALLYLLGRPQEAEILGTTCTFANGTVEEVYRSTTALLREIGRTDIPLLWGAESGEDPRTEAARFIADTVNARPGEVTLVAIGLFIYTLMGSAGDITDNQNKITLPNLYNKTLEEVSSATDYVVVVDYYSYDGNVADGRIISQNPAANTRIEPGSTVTVVVSAGPEPQEKVMRISTGSPCSTVSSEGMSRISGGEAGLPTLMRAFWLVTS